MPQTLQDETDNGRSLQSRVLLFVTLLILTGFVGALFAYPAVLWASLCFLPLPAALFAHLNYFNSITAKAILITLVIVALAIAFSFLNSISPVLTSADYWLLSLKGVSMTILMYTLASLSLRQLQQKVIKFIGLLLLAFFSGFILFIYLGSDSLPQGPVSEIICQNYHLLLTYDAPNNGFIANDDLTLKTLWKDRGDLKRDDKGNLLTWTNQEKLLESFNAKGLTDWQFLRVEITKANSNVEDPNYEITALLRRTGRVEKGKIGLVTYLSKFDVPYIVDAIYPGGHTEALMHGNERHVQYQIILPENVWVHQNLQGDFKETVLQDGHNGLALTSDSVIGLDHVIRIKHYAKFLCNPVFGFVTKLSGWTIILWVLAGLGGVLAYMFGVVLDVFKDERLKPLANALLVKIGLIGESKITRPPRRHR